MEDQYVMGDTVQIGEIIGRVEQLTLRRTVMTTRGYLSQSELPVTIGLGTHSHVDEVRVRWPDGSTQTIHDVKVDRPTHIVQPL